MEFHRIKCQAVQRESSSRSDYAYVKIGSFQKLLYFKIFDEPPMAIYDYIIILVRLKNKTNIIHHIVVRV